MGTEVLRPQDYLAERFHLSPSSSFHHRRKHSPATGNVRGSTVNNHHHPSTTNYGYRNPVVRQVHRKKPQHQETTSPRKLASFDDFKVVPNHTRNYYNNGFLSKEDPSHIEYDVVTILRRGASLDSINERIRRDHNNNKIKNSYRFDLSDSMYAGSAFSVSPSPSDLPLPTFFKKHQSFDDSASRDLKRLLRLE